MRARWSRIRSEAWPAIDMQNGVSSVGWPQRKAGRGLGITEWGLDSERVRSSAFESGTSDLVQGANILAGRSI